MQNKTNKTADKILQSKAGKKSGKRFEDLDGAFRFDIENGNQWRVSIRDGDIQVKKSRAKADCIFESNEEDFVNIASGKQNLLTAVMQGRVRVTGNTILAQKFNAAVRSGLRVEQKKSTV